MPAFATAWVGVQGNGVTSVTNVAITSSGNLIAACVTDSTTLAAVNPVTDNKSNTFQKETNSFVANGGDNCYLYYAENATTGAGHTITATSSAGSSFLTICAATGSSLATSSTLDKSVIGTGTSTTLASGNTAATTNANDWVLGFGTFNAVADNTFTAGGAYTMRSQIGLGSIGGTSFLEEKVVAATGAQSASATWGGASGGFVCGCAAFSDGTGGGGGGVTVKSLAAMGVG